MKKLLILFLFLAGCAHTEHGQPSSFVPVEQRDEQCVERYINLQRTLVKTLVPFPFTGARRARLSINRPEGWEQFSGQIYIQEVDWNIDWMSEMVIEDSNFIVIWSGGRWVINREFDIYPLVQEEDGKLFIQPKVSATGVKPAPKVTVKIETVVEVCGEGKDKLDLRKVVQ